MDFANLLIDLRKEAGISQKILAERIGVSQSAIAKLELGKNEATASTLIKLAKFFNVSIDSLVGLEPDIEDSIFSTQQKNAGLKPDEKELLETFRKLDMKNKMHVISYATVRLEGQQERRTI